MWQFTQSFTHQHKYVAKCAFVKVRQEVNHDTYKAQFNSIYRNRTSNINKAYKYLTRYTEVDATERECKTFPCMTFLFWLCAKHQD